jgi:hypothetical protein
MDKLSKLQKWILVSLLDPSNLAKSQRERNAEIYREFFGCDPDLHDLSTVQASLSRAYRRLESRGLIRRGERGKWDLTTAMHDAQGVLLVPGIVAAHLEAIDLLKEAENQKS